MERESAQNIPELPSGMSVDDLRFVHLQLYALDMVQKGWEVLLGREVDGNPAKVSYTLKREVEKDYDWHELVKKIGVLNEEGNIIPEYSIGLNFGNDEPSVLDFNFTGFPTQKTMDVLKSLEDEFTPAEFKPKKLSLLASSEPMDDFFEESPPRRKSFFEGIREIFHR